MLERIKTYLGITDTEKDSLLSILIEDAEAWFSNYTNAASADNPTIITKMVIEDYNRYGSEGISTLSFGSGSESVNQNYSDGLMVEIRSRKKVRMF